MSHKYAILGRQLGHSLSPVMHNLAFEQLAIDAEYVTVECEPEVLPQTMQQLKTEQFSGFNITIPYKSEVIPFLDDIDTSAADIGAVNTVHFSQNQWIGYNTDVTGFLRPLVRLKRTFAAVVVLGNGGAARGVMYALLNYTNPDRIYLCARNQQKSIAVINDFKAKNISAESMDRAADLCAAADLIINTTPVGMYPDVAAVPVAPASLREDTVVYDLIYNPLQTKFLRQMQQTNPDITIIGGLEMLVGQAAESFRIWTDREFPFGMIYRHLENLLIKRPKAKG